MAGNYPDVPSWRIPWDKDGTQVYWNGDNIFDPPLGPVSNANMRIMNDENDSTVAFGYPASNYNFTAMFLFPQPMNIYALFASLPYDNGSSGPAMVQYSRNTTNGVDGTWTDTVNPTDYSVVNPYWRTSITTISGATSVTAMRFGAGNLYTKNIRACHWFGEIASGNPDRLEVWHPTLDQRIGAAAFDWGDVPRSSTEDRQFRIKNLSGSKTANNVNLTMEALTDASPSLPPQFTTSNGGSFNTTTNIGGLSPNQISSVCTVRRITPADAALSLYALRMNAVATSWA